TRIYMERCQEFFENGHHVGTDELTREVKWDPAYELNIPEVDRQHKELLSCISRLSGLVRQNDRDGLKELLDFLASYTQTHFRTEEALMHEFKYPFLKEHVQEHRWFIKHYEKLRKDIEERRHDNKYLFFDINVFLVDWLINHIANTDNHMGKHIIRRGFKPDGQLAPQ
ncbi:MAG: hemerythrin family protein, partial [Rhodospirillales bacterium]|nr:hemerythrin family protein [Rhodospirillales bacterium]